MNKIKASVLVLILALMGLTKFNFINVPIFDKLVFTVGNISLFNYNPPVAPPTLTKIETVPAIATTSPKATAQTQAAPENPLIHANFEETGIVQGESRISLKDSKNQTTCREMARISALGNLVENAKLWITTHAKLSGGELQKTIETASKGIARNSVILFDGIKEGECVYQVKAEVTAY